MKIGIIGGGISGLSAAFSLAGQGHQVDVFETRPEPGGLVSTFDLAGTRIERYYHFLCAQDEGYFALCRDLGLADKIRFRKARTGFFHEGNEYPFTTPLDLLRFRPIPLHQRLRFGLFALEARAKEEWRQLDEIRAKPWLIDRIGLRTYEVVWEPLLALKFGDLHESISAAWIWHRLHRVARSKGRMGYLEGGSGLLLDTLWDRLNARGGKVHLDSPVQGISLGAGGVEGLVTGDGSFHRFDSVVSTVPLTVLADLLPGLQSAYAEALRGIRYIGVVCVVIKLKCRITPCFWLNVNDKRIPFNGIIEYTNLNPIGPDTGHIAYVPYYVSTANPLYSADDTAVFDRSWRALRLIRPGLRDDDVIDHAVFRDEYAQAVCPMGFLGRLPDMQAPIRGLHLLDSAFLYPEDRTQSGLILKARECARKIDATAPDPERGRTGRREQE